ncbi:MAG: hypothetical protein AAF927_15520 [Bacteroidota bacterium]
MFEELILLLNWQSYPLVIIPLIFHWLVFPAKRAISTGILSWVNIITLAVGLMIMLYSSIQIWADYPKLGTEDYPWYLLMGFVLRLILIVGLCLKNARKSIAFSLVIAGSALLNPLVIAITNFHRDYTGFRGILAHFDPVWYQLSDYFGQGMLYLTLAIVLYLLEQRLRK